MGLRYLLDTNTCIYIAKHKPIEVSKRFEQLNMGDAAMSIITYGELLYGCCKSQYAKSAVHKLHCLTDFIPPLELPTNAADFYGKVRSMLEKKGEMIGNNDLWIASHALSLDIVLVTNNHREFKLIKALKLENWCPDNK